ncbi:MAG TPA: hypothetical protein VJZ71_15765 [Phycisphaerae bacterium]|nr:hypothetical protein [Phycisphaerae bacterium]
MADILSIAEICNRYDSEWILVEDPEVDENLEVVRGKVVWHSKDRDEVYQKMLELRPKQSATLFTGRMPKDTAIAL